LDLRSTSLSPNRNPLDSSSGREIEILPSLGDGKDIVEIADRLKVSYKAVANRPLTILRSRAIRKGSKRRHRGKDRRRCGSLAALLDGICLQSTSLLTALKQSALLSSLGGRDDFQRRFQGSELRDRIGDRDELCSVRAVFGDRGAESERRFGMGGMRSIGGCGFKRRADRPSLSKGRVLRSSS
jgi:hypothetical protein